jgi:hypothetical protein
MIHKYFAYARKKQGEVQGSKDAELFLKSLVKENCRACINREEVTYNKIHLKTTHTVEATTQPP